MDIIEHEYKKDGKLERKDVEMLHEWCHSQPHLPKMTEQEVIWFLQSSYYSNERAKVYIDNYFTIRTMSPELFRRGDFKSDVNFLANSKLGCFTILPQKTTEGHTVCLFKFLDPCTENFSVNEFIKIFDMVVMLDLYINGTHQGLRCCLDVKGISFGHVAKLSLVSLKKFFYYLQEGMPVRLKGIHLVSSKI